MKTVAKFRYLRIAPRKVRLVADQIRGKRVEDAQTILRFVIKRAAHPMLKTLNSALAAAKEQFDVEEADLYIAKVTVDEGPKLKRYRARARGVAGKIQKKTSHISITLEEIKKGKAKKKETQISKKTQDVKMKPGEEKKEEEKTVTEKQRRPTFRPVQEEQAKRKQQKGMKRFFRRKTI